jgi:hypothetical protein
LGLANVAEATGAWERVMLQTLLLDEARLRNAATN